jgi:hypothetical protein
MKTTLRENLLVTMGVRAGSMEAAGHIRLPEGVLGEDEVADFVVRTVDAYLALPIDCDISFDEFIETALTEKWGNAAEWFGVVRWCDEDIEIILSDQGFIVTPEAVRMIREDCSTHWFTDGMIEAGFELISCHIRNRENRGELTRRAT